MESQSHKGGGFYENHPFPLYSIMSELVVDTNAVASGMRGTGPQMKVARKMINGLTAKERALDDSDSERGGLNGAVNKDEGKFL